MLPFVCFERDLGGSFILQGQRRTRTKDRIRNTPKVCVATSAHCGASAGLDRREANQRTPSPFAHSPQWQVATSDSARPALTRPASTQPAFAQPARSALPLPSLLPAASGESRIPQPIALHYNSPASARSLVRAKALRTAANASTSSRGEPALSKRISSVAPSHTTAAPTPATVSVHRLQSDG